MLDVGVFGKIRRGDFTVLPYEANKQYQIASTEFNSGSYSYRVANYYRDNIHIDSNKASYLNAPKSGDGSDNYLNWKSINHIYYRNAGNPLESLEGFSNADTHMSLFTTASILTVPQKSMGDGFKKGSVSISFPDYTLSDDSKNNLIDSLISTGSFVDSNYLDIYLGFQELYKFSKKGNVAGANLSGQSKYESNTIFGETIYTFQNIGISSGIPVNSTGSGAGVDFYGNSFVFITDDDKLNYEVDEDFTISLWANSPASQSILLSDENIILSKKSYSQRHDIGTFSTSLRDTEYSVRRNFVSSSLSYNPTDRYPYEIAIKNQTAGADSGKIIFRRSDGNETIQLMSSASISGDGYHHISIVKQEQTIKLIIDGNEEVIGLDVSGSPINHNYVMLGGDKISGGYNYSGSLDEVRFYNTSALTSNVSSSLANNSDLSVYQTNKVGNVFYRRGEVILTSPVSMYHEDLKNQAWQLNFKNIYPIYEYETLVRIPKGTYNRTMNPSSRKNYKSDLYLNDFTGSLTPYATTVGLYNKDHQLVAVGKFARPLKMRDDVDINVIVRWDF